MLNEHKLAVLHAWWESAPSVEAGFLRPTPYYQVLGGIAAEHEVWWWLRDSVIRASVELQGMEERAQGREWFQRYIEEPADRELMTTLRMAVPRRKNEADADYEKRLRTVEDRFRGRLPYYIREPYKVSEESL